MTTKVESSEKQPCRSTVCYKHFLNRVHHSDFLNNDLPDKSVNLIIADFPYFEVKGDFDFVWNNFDEFLSWVELCAKEFKRLLKDNGTLFVYGHAKKIAYKQVIFDKYFNLENSMIWRKIDSMQYQYYSPKLNRKFNTHNERILMYSLNNEKNTFAEYLNFIIEKNSIKKTDIQKLYPSKTGGLTGCVTNWLKGYNVMTKEQYNTLQVNYNCFERDYNELIKEYETCIRFFYNPNKFEEVLEFSQESNITKNYDHETQKPETLTRALILTCSRENDLVLVPFAGSGTECAMAKKEKRNFIGFDINPEYVEMSNNRCNAIQSGLF